jgi:hypothetical protein
MNDRSLGLAAIQYDCIAAAVRPFHREVAPPLPARGDKDPMLHKAMAEAADPVLLDTEGGYQLMIADPEVRPKVPTSSMWRHNPAAGSGS